MAGIAALGELKTQGHSGLAVAERSDDADIRALLRQSVVDGAIRVAFTREPDYFAGEGLAGATDVTIVGRERGRLTGVARCSTNQLLQNGESRSIAYLGELRLAHWITASPRWLREGYQLIRELTRPSVESYFTSITADNTRVRRVLEHGARFGLPAYRPLCALATLVMPVPVSSSDRHEHDVSALSPDELVAFLRSQTPKHHLALSWSDAQWAALEKHGISVNDFVAVRCNGRVTAVAAIWDQRSFRQTVIDGYSGSMRVLRPAVNVVRAIGDQPLLPAPGEVLAQGALLGSVVTEPADWHDLLGRLRTRARTMGLSWLSVSRDVRDPELLVLRRISRAREYHTTLYEVVWRDCANGGGWDGRLFRPEVGLL